MTYEIIKDETALKDFIDNFLPDLQDNERFYLCLFARKKYAKNEITSSDHTQLKRFVSDKDKMIDKIRQLEIPMGRYMLKKGSVPPETLVLYITPNPRCMRRATIQMGKKCWDLLNSNNYNIHKEALSCIQRSKSYSYVVDFDIDTKDVDLSLLEEFYTKGSDYYVLETRGGYHILVDPREMKKNYPKSNWYGKITNMYDCDQTGDQLIPVPGCGQGGFIPKFI